MLMPDKPKKSESMLIQEMEQAIIKKYGNLKIECQVVDKVTVCEAICIVDRDGYTYTSGLHNNSTALAILNLYDVLDYDRKI